MSRAIFAPLLLGLAACAAPPPAAAQAPPAQPPTEVFEGWISFGEGFHLWRNRNQIGSYTPDACLSGALPRALFDSARPRLDGRRVRIRGRLSALPQTDTRIGVQTVRTWRGARFSNECGGPAVIFGESIEAVR